MARVTIQDPLARVQLPIVALAAGHRLRLDFERFVHSGELRCRIGQDRVDQSRKLSYLDPEIARRGVEIEFVERLGRLGPDLAEVVILACLHYRPITDIEFELDLPKRSAKVLLRIGLEMLARCYEEPDGTAHERIGRALMGEPNSRSACAA